MWLELLVIELERERERGEREKRDIRDWGSWEQDVESYWFIFSFQTRWCPFYPVYSSSVLFISSSHRQDDRHRRCSTIHTRHSLADNRPGNILEGEKGREDCTLGNDNDNHGPGTGRTSTVRGRRWNHIYPGMIFVPPFSRSLSQIPFLAEAYWWMYARREQKL